MLGGDELTEPVAGEEMHSVEAQPVETLEFRVQRLEALVADLGRLLVADAEIAALQRRRQQFFAAVQSSIVTHFVPEASE